MVTSWQNSLDLIALDVACALLGRCSVILPGDEHVHKVVEMLGSCQCQVVRQPEPALEPIGSFSFWEGDEELFSLFATSGSVGVPKLVRRTRRAWRDTLRDTAAFGAELCVTLSFTALAHSAPRTELWWNLACGGQSPSSKRASNGLEENGAAGPPNNGFTACHELTLLGS